MEWISVKDNLPDRDQDVLIFCKPDSVKYPNGIYIAHRDDFATDAFYDGDYNEMPYVTHWMPLPESPKQS